MEWLKGDISDMKQEIHDMKNEISDMKENISRKKWDLFCRRSFTNFMILEFNLIDILFNVRHPAKW